MKELWAVVLVLAISAVVFGQYGFNGELVRDDAIYLYSGQQMADGTPPYKSVFDQKAPLASMIAGLGVFLSRLLKTDDVLTVRVLFLLVGSLTVAGIYLLADALFKSRQAAFLAAFSFVNFWGFGHQSASGPRAKTPMLLFQVLALWLATRKKWFLAGMCGSLAALAWQPAAITLLVTALLAFVQSKERSGRPKNIFKVCAGACVPFLVISAYFILNGAYYSFVDGAVLFVFTHFERVPDTLRGNVADLVRAIYEGYQSMFVPILLGFGALAVIFGWRLHLHGKNFRSWLSRDHFAPLLLSLPLFAFYSATDFQGYSDLYVLLPYAAVGFGWLLHLALRGFESVSGPGLLPGRFLTALVCVVLVTGAAWMYRHTGRGDRKLEQQRIWADTIDSTFSKDDRVVSVGVPEALVLLHKTNPNPYVYILNGIDKKIDAETPGGFAGWLEELQRYDPSAILYGDTRGRHKNELEDWLNSRYRLTTVGEWAVYVRP
jgi:hypothetical protein